MPDPYSLTIRFSQRDAAAQLYLETESGAGDVATMQQPFADDLPLVLRALDIAQYQNPSRQLARERYVLGTTSPRASGGQSSSWPRQS
jgi:hypothetical protein